MNSATTLQLIIASILLAASPVLATGDIEAGQIKASSCVSCHGVNGEGVGDNPPLAGLDAAALTISMQAYRTEGKIDSMMGMLMQSLSEEEMANLAAYYASLPKQQ